MGIGTTQQQLIESLQIGSRHFHGRHMLGKLTRAGGVRRAVAPEQAFDLLDDGRRLQRFPFPRKAISEDLGNAFERMATEQLQHAHELSRALPRSV